MAPLIGFIVLVIDLYIWVVIASAILSWLVAFNVVNMNNRVVFTIADTLYRLTEPALRPIRNILPNLGRHRYFAGDFDPYSAVLPRRGAARLACAGGRSVRVGVGRDRASLALCLRQSCDGVILTMSHAKIFRRRDRGSRGPCGRGPVEARVCARYPRPAVPTRHSKRL